MINKHNSVWVLDDDKSIRWVLEKSLTKTGLNTMCFDNGEDLLHRLEKERPDAIISDIRMPGINGLDLLSTVHDQYPQLPVIIMTAHSDLDSAVSSYSRGAFEYLPKPFDIDEAVAMTVRALEHAREKNVEIPAPVLDGRKDIIGEAPAMQEVFRAIGRLSQSNITVLINGESGTGKELIARHIHQLSGRKGPFLAINCGAINDLLAESELFGHEAGAFTGAAGKREGWFEAAHDGTLFLDEIGDMPLAIQAKFLRVLQEGEIEALGSNTVKKIDVRIIAATSQDLEAKIADKSFRADLYYRVAVLTVHVPPLRERREDMALLCETLLEQTLRAGDQRGWVITPEAIKLLQAHAWPGNVRELRNVLERAAALAPTEVMDAGVIGRALPPGVARSGIPLQGLAHAVADTERQAILDALEATGGQKSAAALRLGVSRSQFYEKLKRHNIDL